MLCTFFKCSNSDSSIVTFTINDFRSESGGLPFGLHLNSTAILHTFAGVQLWLHGPMHQG